MSSNFSQIWPLTAELSALDWVKLATLAPSFLFGSSLFLEVTRTSITSQMSSNFDQIRLLTAELSALSVWKINIFVVATLASLFFSGSSSFLQVTRITTIPRMSSNFGQIEFRPDPTSDCGVSCPLVFEKSIFCIVATLAPSILIGYSSFLEVTTNRVDEGMWRSSLDRSIHTFQRSSSLKMLGKAKWNSMWSIHG